MEAAEDVKNRFRNEFGMTNAPRHPELVSGSNLVPITIGDNFTPQPCRKFGFTLAEVLITLGIIGVVAAITLPAIVQKQQEKVTITKLKQTYNILSQAVEMAQVKYEDIHNWEATGDSQKQSDLYFERITEQLTLIKDCGNPSCYSFCGNGKKYVDLKGNTTSVMPTVAHQGLLKNGAMFSISWAQPDNGKWWGKYAAISVDINGSQKPNTIGKDVFIFEIRDMTDNWTTYRKPYLYPAGQFFYLEECLNYQSSGNCTAWVIRYGNMDYLHCPEKLKIDGPHSCKEANVTKLLKTLIK